MSGSNFLRSAAVFTAVVASLTAVILRPERAVMKEDPPDTGVVAFVDKATTRATKVIVRTTGDVWGIQTPEMDDNFSPFMEGLAQGVSDMETSTERLCTRVSRRAQASIRRQVRQEPKSQYEPDYIKPHKGRLWGVDL